MIRIEAWGETLRVVGGDIRGRPGPALAAARALVRDYPYTAADPDPELGLAQHIVKIMGGRILRIGPRDKDETPAPGDDVVQ